MQIVYKNGLVPILGGSSIGNKLHVDVGKTEFSPNDTSDHSTCLAVLDLYTFVGWQTTCQIQYQKSIPELMHDVYFMCRCVWLNSYGSCCIQV